PTAFAGKAVASHSSPKCACVLTDRNSGWARTAPCADTRELYDVWETAHGKRLKNYEMDIPTRPGKYHDRMVITSHDDGNTWRPASTKDFLAGSSRKD
ncbi:MAG: hypothetical protein ACLFTT_17395, partial [Candidatus Hydrogenedentota bacterium]